MFCFATCPDKEKKKHVCKSRDDAHAFYNLKFIKLWSPLRFTFTGGVEGMSLLGNLLFLPTAQELFLFLVVSSVEKEEERGGGGGVR